MRAVSAAEALEHHGADHFTHSSTLWCFDGHSAEGTLVEGLE